jgi:beta-N-acetylhexosaminidase
MRGRPNPDSLVKLHENPNFVSAVEKIASIGVRNGELPLV